MLVIVFTGSDNQGLRIAASTYLKNFTRRHMERKPYSLELHIEFRNQLAQALLRVEPAVLKVLIEAVCTCYLLIYMFVLLASSCWHLIKYYSLFYSLEKCGRKAKIFLCLKC